MNDHRRAFVPDLLVFGLLVAIGVAGRWNEPVWGFTPTAAVSLLAGYYFSRWGIALMVPVAILAITDLILPAYDSKVVMIATYAVMTLPVWLGRAIAASDGGWTRAARWAICGLLPATVFFIVTNFAVWAFQSDYQKSLAGLVECYAAAVPFFRWMLAGDIFYLAVLLTCWSIAGVPVLGRERVAEPARK